MKLLHPKAVEILGSRMKERFIAYHNLLAGVSVESDSITVGHSRPGRYHIDISYNRYGSSAGRLILFFEQDQGMWKIRQF